MCRAHFPDFPLPLLASRLLLLGRNLAQFWILGAIASQCVGVRMRSQCVEFIDLTFYLRPP